MLIQILKSKLNLTVTGASRECEGSLTLDPLLMKAAHLSPYERVEVNGKNITPEDVLGESRRGRKIVYSGDTRPSQAVVELAEDCDVLIHDATLSKELEEKAVRYGHSSTTQAAEIASKAKAKVLFLTHISPRYDDALKLEDEAKQVFKCSYSAADFLEFEVKLP